MKACTFFKKCVCNLISHALRYLRCHLEYIWLPLKAVKLQCADSRIKYADDVNSSLICSFCPTNWYSQRCPHPAWSAWRRTASTRSWSQAMLPQLQGTPETPGLGLPRSKCLMLAGIVQHNLNRHIKLGWPASFRRFSTTYRPHLQGSNNSWRMI